MEDRGPKAFAPGRQLPQTEAKASGVDEWQLNGPAPRCPWRTPRCI